MLCKCYEARLGLFKSQGSSRKQFSQLWRSCEARASLFKKQERPSLVPSAEEERLVRTDAVPVN